MTRATINHLLGLLFLIAPLAGQSAAVTWTETGTSPASWNLDANWGAGPFPHAADAAADMNVDITVNQTVNLNQAITVGSLSVGDTDLTESITIAPNGGSLTFDVTAGSASLTKAASTSTTVIDTITAPVVLNDNLTITNNSAFYFTAGAPQGMVRLSGGISDGGAGKGITKSGPGTVSLQGGTANTYSGETVVTQGTLLVQSANSIPDASPVSVIGTGAGVQAILRWGLFNQGVADTIGPLTLGGTTTTSQAIVNVGFPSATTLTLGGNVTYDAANNPLGALMGVSGMSLGRISLGGATRTFTVGDSTSAADDLSINQLIISGNLIKDGAGTLAFGVANNSLTNVWVKEGRAVAYQPGGMSSSVTLGDASGSNNVIVHMERGGGTAVTVAGGNTGTMTLTGRFGIGSGSQAMSGLITLGDINGAHDLTMYALSSGPHYTGGIVGNGNLNVSGSGATLFLDASGPGVNFNGAMNVGALGNTVDVSAIIGPNVTAVNQVGGTLNLRGVNTYTGDTTVSAGTLNLFDNAGLLFEIGANGVNNSILGTSTVNLNGDFYFDLTSAGMSLGDSWNIVDVANLNETFGGTFTVNGFADIGGNQWEFMTATNTYTFSESTGMLVVTAAVPEPSTLGLAALGMAGLGLIGWRRRRKN